MEAAVKKTGYAILTTLLSWQLSRLRRKYKFQIIAVAGSLGKTSTKAAIARTLEAVGRRVQFQEGNYNDPITVPLVAFGHTMPGLFDFGKWLKIIQSNEQFIKQGFPYDFVVLELGTDAPGTMAKFAYLNPDLTVVTAIAPEHMEYFQTIDGVAAEEMAVVEYSKKLLINTDDVPAPYLPNKEFESYSLTDMKRGYSAGSANSGLTGQDVAIYKLTEKLYQLHTHYVGKQGLKAVLAAGAAADILGVSHEEAARGLTSLQPFPGRMQILQGVNNSTIIDDTYNAAPDSVKAALDVLYGVQVPQKIAILGSMNELGPEYGKQAHAEVGNYLDPSKVDMVVTIGKDAQEFLAPAAQAKGFQVQKFLNPSEAGEFVKAHVSQGAVILAKGSQNGVFAEEAVKQLLADPADNVKLVRQSEDWLKKKHLQFKKPYEE